MQQIAEWLEKLGMSEYAERFAKNDIDVSVLRHLTDQDLKELGISLGHRRKMLAAITEMTGTAAAAPAPAPATEPKPQDTAERRQVTVMFSDLVGSTALSARMDPEDLREVISAYQKRVAETVQRFGGFVAKYMGDGVLVYFGYPEAHEDDAKRAVRAGLELIKAVGGLKSGAPLRTRLGIATGLVVVGDLIGSGAAQEQTVVGETPNLAARLQGIAEPNTVVIAENTRKLLGNLFELHDLGTKEVKGIAEPLRAWAALRPSSVASRFEALHGRELTELVGREEELELLLRRWSKAKGGEGQVVLISGEAGIGKSRLTAALLERLASEPHTRWRYFCSPQHTDSALYPMIVGQLEHAAGFTYDDTSLAKLDKLDALLARSTPREEVALFAEMMSLPNDGRYPRLELTPQQRRQRTLEALTAQIEAGSRQKPVLMIFEDVHWIDPTSLEALGRAVGRIRTLRVLLIVTYRPEFEPPWIGRPHVTALILNRLGDREVAAIIEGVIGNKPLRASIRKGISERSDGIPLFVEEITKSVLEAVGEGVNEGAGADVLPPSVAVPASLHASLMARLDRLGAAKEIAQIGAATGREFSHALLAAVASKPEVVLATALDRILAAGLLFREGVPPHVTYLFKHALEQDAAYGTLLREPRRALHARIAQTLESEFPEIAGNQPELLARHYTEAGMIERAAGLWGKAGARFLDRSALVEAIEALRRALDQTATLPSTPALRRREVNLQVALLAPLAHVKGYTAPETKAAAERARLLIEQAEARGEPPEDPMQLFRVLNIFWNTSAAAFNGDVMRELATQVLALAEKEGAALPLVTAHHLSATTGTQAAPRDTAERRQVTVMFSDLVGSTALSARMDPEDLREVISAYQKCVAETVQRFGGFVAKYMGDGVLVYFGYPQAHEDDAERAVRAGLELIEAVGGLKSGAPLQTRVGIATGLVVVGDLIGSGEAQERGIVGETPNRAARLQSAAEPNTVVIAEGTRKLLGNLFDLKDLGAQDLKGMGDHVKAWAILRPASVESRFEALHASGLTELVGREEELELLLRRWSKAKTGEGQVVLLSGEAGIGKSRLTAALLERLATEPHTRLRYFCSPQHTDSALYPIIGQMERAAGLAHGDTAQVKLDKVDALLAQTLTSKQDAGLFAEMLSLPNDGRYPALDLIPEQRRQRTLEALTAQLAGLARQKPVLMIVEDAHWVDPTSLEVFGRTVDQIKTLPALLIVTFRPEFNPPWAGRSHVTSLALNRLGERETAAIITHLVGNKELPTNVMAQIVDRTDGIPLFVEEMTKAVLEAESQGAVEHLAASVPPSALPVPASLQASLMARLDRLGSAKEVAQIGAAIGREFSHSLLAAVVRKPEADINPALDRLIAAGLLFRQGVPPHATYLFKHALVQDAAYGTLLREPRRALHARIAETLETQFAEIAERQPELLARHCTEAGLTEKAASFWGKAGRRSLERSALVEAAEQLTRALGQIAALPATPAQRREQINLQVALITPLIHVKGYAAPETKAAAEQARLLIEQAEALGEPPEDPLLLFSVLYGFWVGNFVTFNGDAMREVAAQVLALAEKQGATVPLMVGHRYTATSLLFTGDIAQGRTHYDRAIALYDPAKHRPLAVRFGQDVGVAILSYRAMALWVLGYPDAALADTDQAISEAREIGQAATLMYALGNSLLFTHLHCGNYATANAIVDELVALADEKGAPFWRALGIVLKGCVLALTDKASDAVQMISAGITAWRSTGATASVTCYLSNLARGHAELGQLDDAWRCIDEATTAVETTKERLWEAEVDRMTGEIALKSPEPDAVKAEAHFERALAVARKQQAKSWELRAAMSMARLWRDQGKREEARELLAPVYGWFTEGFDTRDLKEAKALLDEL